MHELGQTNEALPLMNESNIYGGVGSDEVRNSSQNTASYCFEDDV